MTQTQGRGNEPIAIIGSGCRFPGGASSPSKLWELLQSPRDLVKKIPKDRFNVDAFYHPDGSFHGRTNARYGYFLEEDPYAFDPGFFNIPPTEAETVDPQQRLLLETVYDGIISAGLKLEDLRGSPTAVYVGLMQRDFLDSQNYDLDALNTYAATGTAASILSNRVSYVFDWHGPSMTIDTACSSSLVALHHAVEQLRTGCSKVAVAAGSNLMLGPVPFISASKLNMFSPNGRSRMWDIAADGYARGEGVAAVVMKTLSQAIADGDMIECVIRESGVNQDGKTAGITMPNASAQEALIRQVYERAGLNVNKPEDRCQYFEAHGTGTPAGDPQEAKAISSAFFSQRQRADDEEPLYVGSIKTVIGHTEGTAGIAGVIKASQAIQHGHLVPNMLLNELSPRVAPFCTDLRVVTKQQEWPALKANQPRRVSVNSFGFGGTNAHVILESYVPEYKYPVKATPDVSTHCLAPITLSANSDVSLKASMESLGQYLKNNPNVQVQDLAWTLLKKRSNLQVRHTIPATNIQGVCEALERDAPKVQGKQTIAINSDVRTKPQVLGVFTGQGAQWPGMGKSLITKVPYARNIVSELDQSLQLLPEEYRPTWKLIDQLLLDGEDSNVHDATFSQPLCCAVQIILTKLMLASGVSFKVVVGHSSGEIASAFAAGYISASQAIRIAYLRGLTSKHASSPNGAEGAMMAVGTSFEDATELCSLEVFENRLAVAASNAPESVTISGDKDAILEAQETLNDEGKFNRVLKVNKAYHSHHMRPCAEPYVAALKACWCDTFTMDAPPTSTWISSVFEGKVMKPGDLNAEYWAQNLLSPVLFSFAVEQAVVKHTPLNVGIEVGAHPALKNPSIQTVENCAGAPIPYTGCMERGKDDTEAFSSCLGYLWSRFGSAAIDVQSLYSCLSLDARDLSKDLPSYAWDHSRSYKKESRTLRSWLAAEKPHMLLGKRLAHSSPLSVQWQNFVRQRDIEWLDGHSLQGQTVFPGAGRIKEVNVDKAQNIKPEFLIETVLRLEDGANWEDHGILWTQEPEIFLSGGKVIVPRLRPDVAKNNRLNAVRRPILIDSDPAQETLGFEFDADEPFFKLLEDRFIPSTVDGSVVKIQGQFSFAKALRVGRHGYFNLLQGTIAGSSDTVVALLESNASSVQVPSDRLVTVDNKKEACLLPAIAADLIAQTLVCDVAPSTALLVFGAPSLYVEALSRRAAASRVALTFALNKTATCFQPKHAMTLPDEIIKLNTSPVTYKAARRQGNLVSVHENTPWPSAFLGALTAYADVKPMPKTLANRNRQITARGEFFAGRQTREQPDCRDGNTYAPAKTYTSQIMEIASFQKTPQADHEEFLTESVIEKQSPQCA
ncbi:ketoacyl-synt-domain-containing protein [Colletotrichum eremochloae]|nr:ketoacyl-synt-domain-containing protein [Colletotrichum eremochloae]